MMSQNNDTGTENKAPAESVGASQRLSSFPAGTIKKLSKGLNFLFLALLAISCITFANRNLGLTPFWTEKSLETIAPESGFAYTSSTGFEEWSSHAAPSPSVVLENGKPLGKPNSLHQDIRDQGKGRYSFWYDYLYFSTSDNSNPIKNGKNYSIKGPLRINGKTAKIIYGCTLFFFLASRTFRYFFLESVEP